VTYDEWILKHWHGRARGRCAEATIAMVVAFPELRRVRGHYDGAEHWWCVAPDGSVVDPTASQFWNNGLGEYIAWIEGSEEPVGKCINCGEYSWASKGGNRSVCSVRCDNEMMEEFA
jgi:hypothetical protein